MKRYVGFLPVLTVISLLLLAGCGAASPQTIEMTRVVEKEVMVTQVVEGEVVVMESVVVEPREEPESSADGPAGASDLTVATSNRLQTQRLIIKNGEITIAVENSPAAVDGVVQVAVDYGGYIISQRVWQQYDHTYATITIGVPVDEFENAMRRLRTMADRVVSETASGTDVTDEYVDLGSKLENLQATRDRIRTFLDQATTVEESLEVNKQLSEIEGQIAEIQGRINYLSGRAAYSTITVQIEPIVPTPTPSPTPTPTPTPTPEPWLPGEKAEEATGRLTAIVQGLTDILIYNGIVCGPFILVLLVGAWVVFRLWQKLAK